MKAARFLFDRGFDLTPRNAPALKDHVAAAERVTGRMPRLLDEPAPFAEAIRAAIYFGAGALWMFLALGVWVR